MLLWMDLRNPYVWACLLVTVGFGLIGFLDDYDKVKKRTTRACPARCGCVLEFLVAGFATWLIVRTGSTNLYLPFVQGPVIDLGRFYIVVRGVRDRRVRQCGEPDRRARRAGDHAGDHRVASPS